MVTTLKPEGVVVLDFKLPMFDSGNEESIISSSTVASVAMKQEGVNGLAMALVQMESTFESVARVAHEVNRAYCASIGDHSQPAWADAPEWQRESAVAGVKFMLANPDAKPSDSHGSWLAEKERSGWKYGPVEDPEKREHPCIVPYDELPVEQRTKDFLFRAVARSMILAKG